MVMCSHPPLRQRGFSLLEAVVALAVLAAGASALYAWINTSLIVLQRVDTISQQTLQLRNATAYMMTVDPLTQPRGEVPIGDATLHWQLDDTVYRSPMLAEDGSLSINDASLHNARVEIRQGDQRLTEFDMWLLGISQQRRLEDVLF